MPTLYWLAKDIATIADFLSPQECADYIRLSESLGYDEAPVTTEYGVIMLKDLRNNDRVILDDTARAADLWRRVRPFIPTKFKKKWTPVGVNERLRFYRYDVNQQFDWHMDGYFERDNGERSFFTFMIYLNEGFESGATSFAIRDAVHGSYDVFAVTPKIGMALLFHHPISHKGEPVTSGRKYVLRSDIMFDRIARAVAPSAESEE